MPSSSNVHGPVTGLRILIIRIGLISAGSAGFESWELADDHPAKQNRRKKVSAELQTGQERAKVSPFHQLVPE